MRTPADYLNALAEREATGEAVDFLYFWKALPGPAGRPGPGCLSQWWQQAFTVDGVEYGSAEHWMMAGKARLFSDDEALDRILAADHPVLVKKLGQGVRNFDDATWKAHRFEIVVAGNRAKFGSDPALAEYLVGTGDRVLVEASPLDRIWGIGLADDDPRAAVPSRWRGLNLLGFALMEVRAELSAK
ncbi:NADAR family protein [Cryptosporangium minutisporangium]|uniref:NADAR family protein n=1 Tax=Cryptosporangium minutisporangium TaxID=113569 RepID=A0ABP6SW24_9ACTN